MINIRIKNLYGLLLGIGLSAVSSYSVLAQQRLGDNLGNHKAGQDLDMNTKSITNADVINADGAVIGQVGAVNNSHVALQVNGTDQAMLVPRVTDLLNATTPSIPVASAVNGMIVYDLATQKFYLRQNGVWATYASVVLDNGRIWVGNASNIATAVTPSGDVTLNNAGVTTIGVDKVTTTKILNGAVTSTKLQSNATDDTQRAVGTNHIRNQAVTTDKIAADAVTTTKIINNAVTPAKLQSHATDNNQRAVGTTHIQNQAVTAEKVAPGAANQFMVTNAAATAVEWWSASGLFVDLTSNQNNINGLKTFVSNDGLVAAGSFGTGAIPATGPGDRMMWYPAKGAFRAGTIYGSQWDAENVGNYSSALGFNNTASGATSFAIGNTNTASGINSLVAGVASTSSGGESFAFGNNAQASGVRSFAIGEFTKATNLNSFAGGAYSESNGGESFAFGNNAKAIGTRSFAIGAYTTASGINSFSGGNTSSSTGGESFAFGNNVKAGGISSVAIGTNLDIYHEGSMGFGDRTGISASPLLSNAVNSMTMRFGGGYRFMTNGSSTTPVGLSIGQGGIMRYMGDYRAGFDDLSLVDKKYVDDKYASSSAKQYFFGHVSNTNAYGNPALIPGTRLILKGVGDYGTIESSDIWTVRLKANRVYKLSCTLYLTVSPTIDYQWRKNGESVTRGSVGRFNASGAMPAEIIVHAGATDEYWEVVITYASVNHLTSQIEPLRTSVIVTEL